MRARTILALTLALFSFSCTSSPTSPGAADLTGRWDGTFTVTGCQWTGSYRNCGVPLGTKLLAGAIFLEPDGNAIRGYAHHTSWAEDLLRRETLVNGFVHPFQATMQPDGTMTFANSTGLGPTAVYEFEWDLKLVEADRLEGSLRSRNFFYKVQGDVTMTGPAVLTRTTKTD